MSVDPYLDRMPAPGYDCAAFAREVWLGEVGEDLADAANGLLSAQFVGRIGKAVRAGFIELPAPVDPCIVIMQRRRGGLHMGLYIRGNVLHLQDNGVVYQSIDAATRLFQTVKFALCKKN